MKHSSTLTGIQKALQGSRKSGTLDFVATKLAVDLQTLTEETAETKIPAYLDTLPKGKDDIPRRGDLAVGEDEFRKSCSYCHSFGGLPIEPPRPGRDPRGHGGFPRITLQHGLGKILRLFLQK